METKICHCDLCHAAVNKDGKTLIPSHQATFSFWGYVVGGYPPNGLYDLFRPWSSNSNVNTLCETCFQEYNQLVSAFAIWLQKRKGIRMPNIVITEKGVEVTSVNTENLKEPRRLNK